VLLHHGLTPTAKATDATATALLEAHFEGGAMALDGRSPLTLEIARQAATAPARLMTGDDGASLAVRSPAQTSAPNFEEVAERYVRERQRDRETAWIRQTEVQHRATFRASPRTLARNRWTA
jgi:hypothetical protein